MVKIYGCARQLLDKLSFMETRDIFILGEDHPTLVKDRQEFIIYTILGMVQCSLCKCVTDRWGRTASSRAETSTLYNHRCVDT